MKERSAITMMCSWTFDEMRLFLRAIVNSSDLDEKLVAAYQDLSKVQGKPIGKSTEEMLEFLGTKERENFVIPPAVLDPLVRAYEAKHEFFENEVITLQGDLKRMAATVELLLNDNNKLRSHLTKRDSETSQLLETIGLNDGETVLKLRKQITVLEDEMRLLYQQLDQQKELRSKTSQSQDRLERENEELRRAFQKMKTDLEETKLKSQQSAEHRVVVNQSLAELQKKLDVEIAEKSRLEGENRKQKDQMARLEQARKEWERKMEMRDADSRKNEEMRLQEVALLTNSVNNLKSELHAKEREYNRLDQMVLANKLA
jgi:chromosome segregation ATPase